MFTQFRIRSLVALAVAAMLLFVDAAHAASYIYGNSAGSDAWLYKIDAATGAVVSSCDMPKGNGRGIVIVGSTVYYTTADSGNVYKTDFSTCADNGIAFTVAGTSSLSAIAYDGTDFWIGDYAGSNNVFKYTPTGTLLGTVSLANCGGNCDGLEFFNGKLIENRGDASATGYDVYSTSGTLLTPQLIAPTPFAGTGIAFDGTNFYVSDIFNQKLQVYDGTTGAFINTITITGLNPAGNVIEDLSADYSIVLGPPVAAGIPTLTEWGMIILSVLLALGAFFALRRQRQ